MFHKLQHSGPEREAGLKSLSKALRDPSAQLTFIRYAGNCCHLKCGIILKQCCVSSMHNACLNLLSSLGWRTVYICSSVSSLAPMLSVVCSLFAVFMNCHTLLTPTWPQHVCLPPPTYSPICLDRAPSSLLVPVHAWQCVI